MNTITIELCREDRERLDKVIDLLNARPNCQSCTESVVRMVTASQSTPARDASEPVEFIKDTPAPEMPAEPAQQAETKPRVTKTDIQQKVIQLSAAGKKAQVREIVTAVATKVSDIPEDKLAEVWDKLNTLEG